VPWLEPPSPTKAMATPPVFMVLAASGGAADQRRPAADDAIGAQHALGEVGDVHRAALAAAQAILLPKISAIIPCSSQPLAMQWPWPRCVLAMSRDR